jgi:hypothetical protein
MIKPNRTATTDRVMKRSSYLMTVVPKTSKVKFETLHENDELKLVKRP